MQDTKERQNHVLGLLRELNDGRPYNSPVAIIDNCPISAHEPADRMLRTIDILSDIAGDYTQQHLYNRAFKRLEDIGMHNPDYSREVLRKLMDIIKTNIHPQITGRAVQSTIWIEKPPLLRNKIAAALEQNSTPATSLQGKALRAFCDRTQTNPRYEPNDHFYNAITNTMNAYDAAMAFTLIEGMGLPIPGEEEFTHGTGCVPVFMTPYGLMIKVLHGTIANNFEKAMGNDLVLQPLRYIKLTNGGLMILPGIHPVIADSNHNHPLWGFLDRESRKTPIAFGDQQTANIGLLPVPWRENNEDMFPVVLDHGCVRGQYDSISYAFEKASYHGIQDRVYGKLKARLNECWPEYTLPTPEKLKPFFDECASIVALPENDPKRILVPGWQISMRPDQVASAPLYEARLKAHLRCG
ncbi:MAG: hypothetical protein H6867_03575 [Rhodospirillales bacterium]|nr:hypothetical protein [Rhodospirillales bacterium]MCB9996232.1 hypothetical protein [Rhodospirillales bacterium]